MKKKTLFVSITALCAALTLASCETDPAPPDAPLSRFTFVQANLKDGVNAVAGMKAGDFNMEGVTLDESGYEPGWDNGNFRIESTELLLEEDLEGGPYYVKFSVAGFTHAEVIFVAYAGGPAGIEFTQDYRLMTGTAVFRGEIPIGTFTAVDGKPPYNYSLVTGVDGNDSGNGSFRGGDDGVYAKPGLSAGTYNLYVRCTDSTGKHFQKAITVEAKAYAPPEFNEADFVRFEGGLVTGSLDPQSRIFVTDRVLDIPPFMLARYEVTQALWWDVYQWAIKGGDYADRAGETYSFTVQEAANNDNPALPDAAPSEPDAGKPQTGIIWNNVILWLNALTEMRGLGADAAVYRSSNAPARSGSGVPDYERSGFRLPSEAEWEYAARGGVYSLEPGSPWMDNTVGRTGGPADYKKYAHYGSGISSLTLVGLYRPNTAGLYDMGCNASEWCGDMYKIYFLESITAENTDVWGPTGSNTGTYRVTRGKDYSSTLPPVFGGGAGGNTNDAGSGSNQAAYFYSKPIAGKTGFRIARAAGTGD